MIHDYTVQPIVQSDTTEYGQGALTAIVILAEGDLHILDSAGNDVTITFPAAADAGGAYPFLFPCRIRKVFDTGTTLTDAQMIGLTK